MKIEIFSYHERPIAAWQVRRLYDAMGWWPHRSLADITAVLERFPVVAAWDGEVLVGMARAVSDGRFRAYIEDVMVLPDYRHRGIASQMMEVLVRMLPHIEVVSLFCEPDLFPLYQRSGFKQTASQRVMHKKQDE